jgi:extracellular factor (EF) 3-hydroxypalmitic acid methyl ester biosynthesis protein
LFDYLSPGVARRLAAAMFALLRPGGRLLFGNFVPEIRDRGYMESYMGWRLIYRSAADLQSLIADIPVQQIADVCVFAEGTNNITLLTLRRC